MEKNSDRNESGSFKDHFRINKPLVTLKLVMFLYYGAATAFLPYTTVHMLQVGLTIEEVAVIYAVLPFTVFIGPPIAGLIADKVGNYKVVLMLSILLCGVFHTLLIMVDAHGDITSNFSNATWLLVNSTGSYLGWSRCTNNTCLPWNDSSVELSLVLNSTDCDAFCSDNDAIPMIHLANLDSIHYLPFENQSYNWEMTANLVPEVESCEAIVSSVYHDNQEFHLATSPNCSLTCPVAWWSVCGDANATYYQNDTGAMAYDSAKHQIGFWTYFVTRIFATIFLAISFTMLDSTTVCMVKKHKGELGKQRAFAIIGSSITSPVAGLLVDWLSKTSGKPAYDITFYFADILFAVTLVLVLFFEVEVEKAPGNMRKNLQQLIRFCDVDVYIVSMFLLGSMWGFLESYLFIYLIELSAPSYLLGLTVTVGSLIGVPFLYVADSAVRRVGEVNMLIVAFFTYSVRLIGYSLIYNPWLAMVFEAMEALTIHLMGVASTAYNTKAAPPGLLATLNGVVGASHYSLGRGGGSFVGGTLMAVYGTRLTYQILGIASGIFGVIYFVLYRSYLVKLERKRLEARRSKEGKNERLKFVHLNFTQLLLPADQEALQELMGKHEPLHNHRLSRILDEDALFTRRMSS